MNKREFVLNTLLPYKEDPETCSTGTKMIDGLEVDICLYLAKNGNKCAVGKHMVEGPWQSNGGGIRALIEDYTFEQMLTPEAFAMGFNTKTWAAIQTYHDKLSIHSKKPQCMNLHVRRLEKELDVQLPELMFDE